jgi:uncharacterized protein (DUF1499 family)
MGLLAQVLGRVLPACAASGTAGLPVPRPGALADLRRPDRPNSALAAPAGFSPRPDIVLPEYKLPAPSLFAAIRAVAEARPRTYLHAVFEDVLEAHWVARSAVLNFPDLIVTQASSRGNGASTLILYSRSRYGHSDFGVNRRRLETWIAALHTALRLPAAELAS